MSALKSISEARDISTNEVEYDPLLNLWFRILFKFEIFQSLFPQLLLLLLLV